MNMTPDCVNALFGWLEIAAILYFLYRGIRGI